MRVQKIDAERLKRVGETFHAVLESDSAESSVLPEKIFGGDEDMRREVESLLAAGGMGEVYLAEDKKIAFIRV